ncbi:hypothetical protein H6785_00150 [Candidatus Nomurabacteria bacterium]|nr:hypothetical protein [Candidatus Nomurabacteria bacterium]
MKDTGKRNRLVNKKSVLFICAVLLVAFFVVNSKNDKKYNNINLDLPVDVSHDVVVNEEWNNLRKVTITGFRGNAQEPFISRDDKYLFFNDFIPHDDYKEKKMHWATRVDDVTFKYQGLLEGVNEKGAVNGAPSMDMDNNFYWISTGSYLEDLITVYKGKFTGEEVVDVERVSGDYQVEKMPEINFDVEVSKDGRELYIVEGLMRNGGPIEANFVLSTFNGSRLAQNIVSNINTKALEYAASISSDNLELYFTRVPEVSMSADFGIFVSKRESVDQDFGIPERILGVGRGMLEAPSINDAGNLLYFHKFDGNKFDIYVLERG